LFSSFNINALNGILRRRSPRLAKLGHHSLRTA